MSDEPGFAIWEGIYDEWEDAPVIEGAFDSSKWLDDQVAIARRELVDSEKNRGSIPANAKSRDYILPTVVAMARPVKGDLKVLDFGGGLASSYLPVIASLPDGNAIEFHVVERQGVCEKGREVFPDNMKLFFHAELPSEGHFDVIHAGRSFQYVDDWPELLRQFAGLTPGYLVLAGALAGDIKPFVTMQNYYGYKIRVRFLNLGELIREAESLGFRLISKTLHLSKRLGKEGPLPMDNFPESHRLEHPCQLLFELKQS